MKLIEAINKKHRLRADIVDIQHRINGWNVVDKIPVGILGQPIASRPFDIIEQMDLLGKKIDALIKLQLEIHIAYSDVQELMIKRTEIKGYITFLESINMEEDYFGHRHKAIDELKQLALIESAQDELDEIDLAISNFEFEKVL